MNEVTPPGLCQCGCGQQTNIAKRNDPRHGHVKGQPVRFIHGHSARGENHGAWTGDKGAYHTIHAWLRKHYPKTGICDECGEKGRHTEFALTHGRAYSRNREDYRELCKRCHNRYDEVGGSRWRGTPEAARRAAAKAAGAPPCKCGCGTLTAWSPGKGRWNAYINGHYRDPLIPRDRAAAPRRRREGRGIIQEPMACHRCGREFTPKRRDTQFCSKACKAAARR